jgi:integrase
MATFVKRANSVQAKVNIRGNKATETFPTMKEAKAWAADKETQFRNRVKVSANMTVGEIIEKYLDHYKAITLKKGYVVKPTESHYNRMIREFANTELASMDEAWWLTTVEGWEVSPGTAQRYITFLCTALRYAQSMLKIKFDWDGYHSAKAILKRSDINLVGEANERNRRLLPGELETLKAAVRPTHVPLGDMIDFALCTGLRLSEICNLEWKDLNPLTKMIWVFNRKDPKDKMKKHTHLPLLFNALNIIDRQPTRANKKIFPYVSGYVSALFGHTVEAAGIKDLHFHDLRHEAISRLFEAGYAIQQVALVSGHKNWKHLARYTHVKGEDLHKGPMFTGHAPARHEPPRLRSVA